MDIFESREIYYRRPSKFIQAFKVAKRFKMIFKKFDQNYDVIILAKVIT